MKLENSSNLLQAKFSSEANYESNLIFALTNNKILKFINTLAV